MAIGRSSSPRARIVADRLIVSAGAWVKQLLPQLPVALRVTRQQVLYFGRATSTPFQIGRFPVFIYKGAAEEDAFYGMPEFLGLGVKVGAARRPEVDPDKVDRTDSELIHHDRPPVSCATTSPPWPRPESPVEVCLYTVAPDDQFQVDFLPGRPDVIVASPCSGHGFKFSCLIGRILADLAIAGETDLAINSWQF